MPKPADIWLAAVVRTPFAKVDGPLQALDALELTVPVAWHMVGMLKGAGRTSPCGARSCPA
jgi:acetyl-CoA C-acetyltransferase